MLSDTAATFGFGSGEPREADTGLGAWLRQNEREKRTIWASFLAYALFDNCLFTNWTASTGIQIASDSRAFKL